MRHKKQFFGQSEINLVEIDGAMIHRDCKPHWLALCDQAKQAGFDLAIASGYRSYQRQLSIWNDKAQGKRQVLDKHEQPVDMASLSDTEKLFTLLTWSALPGASRHHWGSEIDIYERSRLPRDYVLQLTLQETQPHGVMADFYDWLNKQFAFGGQQKVQSSFCGFERPYFKNSQLDLAEEPWHLSCVSVASQFESMVDKDELYQFYQANTSLMLCDTVLNNFDEVYDRFIKVT